jgi:hypothetical protein
MLRRFQFCILRDILDAMETLVLMPTEFGLAPTPKSGPVPQGGDAPRLAVYTEQHVTKGTRFLPFEGTVRLGRLQVEPFLPEHDVSNICIPRTIHGKARNRPPSYAFRAALLQLFLF